MNSNTTNRTTRIVNIVSFNSKMVVEKGDSLASIQCSTALHSVMRSRKIVLPRHCNPTQFSWHVSRVHSGEGGIRRRGNVRLTKAATSRPLRSGSQGDCLRSGLLLYRESQSCNEYNSCLCTETNRRGGRAFLMYIDRPGHYSRRSFSGGAISGTAAKYLSKSSRRPAAASRRR